MGQRPRPSERTALRRDLLDRLLSGHVLLGWGSPDGSRGPRRQITPRHKGRRKLGSDANHDHHQDPLSNQAEQLKPGNLLDHRSANSVGTWIYVLQPARRLTSWRAREYQKKTRDVAIPPTDAREASRTRSREPPPGPVSLFGSSTTTEPSPPPLSSQLAQSQGTTARAPNHRRRVDVVA